jgi:hypothetical protein
MRTGQIAFNLDSLLIAGFLVVSVLGILILLIVMPGSPPESRGIWYFTMSVEVLLIVALAVGGVTNFARGTLSTWPTAVMIGGYCISIWLLPLAIWGIVLLRSKINETKVR